MSDPGIVVIGRNEGDRLRRCLESLIDRGRPVVYVDSGSTDGSAALAQSLGAVVVELDPARPFTAARARNEGVARLAELVPSARFVQFVDGDCELVEDWLERGRAELEARTDVAVVCGRLRERFPERSIYNRLADLEWDGPIGEIAACGGIMMVRLEAFRAAGGFNPKIIAAEDDELCLRLRRSGSKVVRLGAEMALHDMAMTRFSQWWRRAVRAGHAYAEGAARHGRAPERHFVRQVLSTAAWGLVLPGISLGLAALSRGTSLSLLLGYPLLAARIWRGAYRRGWRPRDATLYAVFCTLAKIPQALGLIKNAAGKVLGRRATIVEHRGRPAPAPGRS